MNRRTLVVVAVVALMAASAYAADSAHSREAALPVQEHALELHEIFAQSPGVIRDDAKGVTVTAFAVDVIVARVDTDGTLVTACVGSEQEAKRFLEAPIEKIEGRKAKEQ